ncbi:hypothetical protein BDY19DRAFT_997799 [Irpex rosettiformis]|uniref:Uncharacterized protein n=1 Tax=Irpex rosettiformis TaxID=378272 RepID=A0ACB8TQQ3_9APHY|nr:hypothetical protein BDY19DRAFT_997799 [Irpex rosettiformis]
MSVSHPHSNGISHCDNKPSNILIDADVKIKLVNFKFGSMLRLPEGRRNSEPKWISLLPTWYVIDARLAIHFAQAARRGLPRL